MAEFTITSFGATGADTISVASLPTMVEFFVGQKLSTAQAYSHWSQGVSDGTNQMCTSFAQNTTTGKTENSTTRVIKHYELSGSTFTTALEFSVTGFTATDINVNVNTANANYQVGVKIHY